MLRDVGATCRILDRGDGVGQILECLGRRLSGKIVYRLMEHIQGHLGGSRAALCVAKLDRHLLDCFVKGRTLDAGKLGRCQAQAHKFAGGHIDRSGGLGDFVDVAQLLLNGFGHTADRSLCDRQGAGKGGQRQAGGDQGGVHVGQLIDKAADNRNPGHLFDTHLAQAAGVGRLIDGAFSV